MAQSLGRRSLEGFGAYLRGEREARQVSLDELSRVTKIRRSILEVIEGDCVDALPPEVIVRGFIQMYAVYLGLDREEVLSRYEQWKDMVSKEQQREEPFGGWTIKRLMRYGAGGLLVGIMVMALLWVFFGKSPDDKAKQPLAGSSVQAEKEPVRSDVGIASAPAPTEDQEPAIPPLAEQDPVSTLAVEQEPAPSSLTDTVSAVQPDGHADDRPAVAPETEHTLIIEASDRTWIQIQEGPSHPFDIMLYPDERYIRTGPGPFRLTVGNAGGIKIIFDGEELGQPGETGEVVKLLLPPSPRGTP